MAGARRTIGAPPPAPSRNLATHPARRAFITGLATAAVFGIAGTTARSAVLDRLAQRILNDIAEAHRNYKRRALMSASRPEFPVPDASTWQATLEAHTRIQLAIPQIPRYRLYFDTAETLDIGGHPAGRLFYRNALGLGNVATLTFIPDAPTLVPLADHRMPYRLGTVVFQVWIKQNALLILSEDDEDGPSALLRAEMSAQF